MVNSYSKFQEEIFSDNREITKCQSFCTTTTTTTMDNDDAKAIIILRVFSENSRAKNNCIAILKKKKTTFNNVSAFLCPASKDRGYIVLPLSICLSVPSSVCLHKLNMKLYIFPLLLN